MCLIYLHINNNRTHLRLMIQPSLCNFRINNLVNSLIQLSMAMMKESKQVLGLVWTSNLDIFNCGAGSSVQVDFCVSYVAAELVNLTDIRLKSTEVNICASFFFPVQWLECKSNCKLFKYDDPVASWGSVQLRFGHSILSARRKQMQTVKKKKLDIGTLKTDRRSMKTLITVHRYFSTPVLQLISLLDATKLYIDLKPKAKIKHCPPSFDLEEVSLSSSHVYFDLWYVSEWN